MEEIITHVKEMEKEKGVKYYEKNKRMFDLFEKNLTNVMDIALVDFDFFSEVMSFVERTDELLTPKRDLKKWKKEQKKKNFLKKYPWGNMENEGWHKHLFEIMRKLGGIE